MIAYYLKLCSFATLQLFHRGPYTHILHSRGWCFVRYAKMATSKSSRARTLFKRNQKQSRRTFERIHHRVIFSAKLSDQPQQSCASLGKTPTNKSFTYWYLLIKFFCNLIIFGCKTDTIRVTHAQVTCLASRRETWELFLKNRCLMCQCPYEYWW